MNIQRLKTWFLLAGLMLPALSTAQTEPPPPPEEVFHYVVFDAGDALEIDWAVDDGYYMYRDWFGFETDADGIRLGEPEMPEGQVYEDEFLGEQVIYRRNFLIRIPYTSTGDRPTKLDLVIESRGCSDGGFCYMPTTWTETVDLEPAKPKLSLSGLAGSGPTLVTGSNDFPPQEEVFIPSVSAVDGNTVEIDIRIEPGYYIYKDKMAVPGAPFTSSAPAHSSAMLGMASAHAARWSQTSLLTVTVLEFTAPRSAFNM